MYEETKEFCVTCFIKILAFWVRGSCGIESLGFAMVMFLSSITTVGRRPGLHTLRGAWLYGTTEPLGLSCSIAPWTTNLSKMKSPSKKCFKVLMTQKPRPVLWGSLKISYPFCCLLAPGDFLETMLFNLWALKSCYNSCFLNPVSSLRLGIIVVRQLW